VSRPRPSGARATMPGAGPPIRDWRRAARRLVGATVLYNLVEAGVALWSGVVAHSIALVGFGLDSGIELAAAAALLWRLRVETRGADEGIVEAAERRVRRFIGLTFLLLAIYVTVTAGRTLLGHGEPAESLVGVALAVASLVTMPLISWAKMRAADRIGSEALRSEAKETLACAYLSFTLLLGLAANAWLGWRWADPVAALAMVPWLVKEGAEGLRGEAD
jgi:divalent metal cation (Fe/Co/Zn/Cd) transporter